MDTTIIIFLQTFMWVELVKLIKLGKVWIVKGLYLVHIHIFILTLAFFSYKKTFAPPPSWSHSETTPFVYGNIILKFFFPPFGTILLPNLWEKSVTFIRRFRDNSYKKTQSITNALPQNILSSYRHYWTWYLIIDKLMTFSHTCKSSFKR